MIIPPPARNPDPIPNIPENPDPENPDPEIPIVGASGNFGPIIRSDRSDHFPVAVAVGQSLSISVIPNKCGFIIGPFFANEK